MKEKLKEMRDEDKEMFEPDIDNDDQQNKRKNKINIILISLSIGIILIGLFILLYFTLKDKDDNKEINLQSFNKYKTPYYYYNTTLLDQTISTCLSIANKNNIKIHFSLKSNFNEKILKIISSYKEIGADCVSGGEVKLALNFFKPEQIVFAGIGKTDEEIEDAVDNKIFCFNVESLEEIENLKEI